MKYDFKKIEPKWQKKWEDAKLFEAKDFSDKPKFYGLVEFPYPSGAGMHVGHIKAYSSMEVLSRKRRMQGYNVLFPIGYDAFGLPTENYAIKTNTHPRVITDANIEKFSNQLRSVGFSFDWSRTVDTSKDDYYRWTQWIFLKLFDHGLVFRDKTLVNYCPHCKVVLSNEDSQGGKCDICHTDVIQLPKDVWYLKITEYADKLLKGLDTVEYPEAIIDEVRYINLIPGKTYIVNGTLMDKETGSPVTAGGKPVTVSQEFVPGSADGSVTVVFEFDASLIEGRSVTAFEKVTSCGKEVFVHEDIEDKEQSIDFPWIRTSAEDMADGDKEIAAEGTVQIKDTVTYRNLTPGTKYRLSGVLMDKASGKPAVSEGREITGETVFTASEKSGKASVTFRLNSADLKDGEWNCGGRRCILPSTSAQTVSVCRKFIIRSWKRLRIRMSNIFFSRRLLSSGTMTSRICR